MREYLRCPGVFLVAEELAVWGRFGRKLKLMMFLKVCNYLRTNITSISKVCILIHTDEGQDGNRNQQPQHNN